MNGNGVPCGAPDFTGAGAGCGAGATTTGATGAGGATSAGATVGVGVTVGAGVKDGSGVSATCVDAGPTFGIGKIGPIAAAADTPPTTSTVPIVQATI